MARRRLDPDVGFATQNYAELNEAYYAVNPTDYIRRRLRMIALMREAPDALHELEAVGLTSGEVTIEYIGDGDRQSDTWKQERQDREEFITADAWQLLNHAAETLIRVYLAHCDGAPCPVVAIAKRDPAFKTAVRQRFARDAPTAEHHAANGIAFYGDADALRMTDTPVERREAALTNLEGLLRMYARFFLDADAYNALKHGLALRAGFSRLEIKSEEVDLGRTEGAHIEWLGEVVKGDARRWAIKTRWVDVSLLLKQIAIAADLATHIWDVGAALRIDRAVNELRIWDAPMPNEFRPDPAITWLTMTRELLYHDPTRDE